MSPSMILRELRIIFPEFIVTKYGRVDEHTIWLERKGVNGRELFTLSKDSYILKKEKTH